MNRLPVNPLIARGLRIAEEELGTAGLAARLGVAAGAIDDWRMGLAAMPQDKFLELVDVLAALPAEPATRIMVVDDNADAALTLNHLLELLGHHCTAVTDPRHAIEVATQVRPQIAILDINMPHVNGIDLARRFREHADLGKCHLVALTAMDALDYREKIRHAGFDAHLRKPADMALLRAIIAQFRDDPVRP